MKITFYSIIFLLSAAFCLSNIHAQSAIDIVDENADQNEELADLVTEKIQRISNSKRIFIITNENDGHGSGDFITMVTEGQLTARAIVAKMANKRSGIKIIKIYSLTRWNKLRQGQNVQIIRGDDSYFGKDKNKETDEEAIAEGTIASEEDLFNGTLLEDDLNLEDNSKRAIKTDNIVGAHFGKIPGVDTDGASASYTQLNASWAYQVDDNFWAEIAAGRNTVSDFPAGGLNNTTLTNFTIRAKYTITAPFDSYIKPYLGYQILKVESPDAGVDPGGKTLQLSKS